MMASCKFRVNMKKPTEIKPPLTQQPIGDGRWYGRRRPCPNGKDWRGNGDRNRGHVEQAQGGDLGARLGVGEARKGDARREAHLRMTRTRERASAHHFEKRELAASQSVSQALRSLDRTSQSVRPSDRAPAIGPVSQSGQAKHTTTTLKGRKKTERRR